MAEERIMHFGKQTKIHIDNLREYNFNQFEKMFIQAFAEQYGTSPDFDLQSAWNQIQAELNKGIVKEPKLAKGKIHRK